GLAACGSGASALPVPSPTATQPALGVIPTVEPIPIGAGLPTLPAQATISMVPGPAFSPKVLYVLPGTEILVRNEDKHVHNLTNGPKGLRSTAIGPGGWVPMTAPDAPGRYDFTDIYWPDEMKGTLVVTNAPKGDQAKADAAAAATPTPIPSPSPTADPNANNP